MITVIFQHPDLSWVWLWSSKYVKVSNAVSQHCPFYAKHREKSGLVSIHEAESHVIGTHPCIHNTRTVLVLIWNHFGLCPFTAVLQGHGFFPTHINCLLIIQKTTRDSKWFVAWHLEGKMIRYSFNRCRQWGLKLVPCLWCRQGQFKQCVMY